MKKAIIGIIICIVLLCSGYITENENTFREEASTTPQTGRTFQDEENKTATGTEINIPVTPAPENTTKTPYTMRMKSNTPVHSGPGTEYEFVSTIGADGTFTIVEESADTAGNIWGRLKSGLGWVNISLLGSYTVEKAAVTACYADQELIDSGNYLEYSGDLTGYVTKVAVTSDKGLENVRFSSLSYSDVFSGVRYTTREVLYQLERLPENTPLVLNMTFHGDMTTYGLRFTDRDNSIRYFAISQSGKDGSLVFSEYYP